MIREQATARLLRRHERGLTLVDVCVLLVVLALLAAASVRASVRSRESATRIKCASNLRQIGQAMMIYANDHKGAFPRTTFDETSNPVPAAYTAPAAADPFGTGGPGPNDVTAPLFLLLRVTDLTSEVFLCPSAGEGARLSRWSGDPKNASNFSGRATLTYGYTNPYPSATAVAAGFAFDNRLGMDFALAADMAPDPATVTVPANTSREKMIKANSPNHRGDGQNVLYGDVHVDWTSTVFAGSPRPINGAPRDNLYAYGADTDVATPSAGSPGAPQDRFDSVILPAATVGPRPPAPVGPAAFGLMAIAGLLLIAVPVLWAVGAIRRRLRGGVSGQVAR